MDYKLYQVAVIELPKKCKKEDEDTYSQIPKIVLEPVTVIARNDQDAALKVALGQADKLKGVDQNRVELIVRPF